MGRKSKTALKALKAFTLIEVVIVVVILSMLVLLAIAFYRGQIFKGNDARRKSDINRIKIAVEEYEKDYSCYPPALPNCDPGTGLRPYIDKIPCDPITHANYFYYIDPDSGNCPKWYKIYSNIEPNDAAAIEGVGPGAAFNYFSGSPNAPSESGSVVSGSSGPSASGGGGGGAVTGDYYGCINGVCVPISWDPNRPGPECDVHYQQSNCTGSCTDANKCIPWQ